MPADPHAVLPLIDSTLLTDVVRQAQRNPAFDILTSTVQPLSHAKIIDTTGGLFLFSGTGRDEHGPRSWSIVLKILNNPKEWGQDPRYWAYWKRELLAFQSGLLATLPPSLRAPRCYGTTEHEHNGWIWMEHIEESTGRHWSLDQFHRAARQAGRCAGAFLGGVPLPDEPWLSAPFFRSVFADGDWWATHMDPAAPSNAWQSPLVQQGFSEALRSGVLRIWAEKQRFWEVIDRLPQVLCHNDFHRRNLMLRMGADGQEELVALDWAFCGVGALGLDLGELVATSACFFEVEPEEVGELEATVLDGYLAGLQDAGWSGDPQVVRLGYLVSALLGKGATLPGWAAVMLSEEAGIDVQAMYGRSADGVLAGWVRLTEFLLSRADESRQLMRKLGLA
ncbi:MAG TPA: phosphotransferase [Roseiflexaceae bacterium]|nr:phosphotransferase [Roseiflexaceae bacterium]